MREFSSYGPINPRRNYYVPRTALIERCIDQLIGDGDEGGHFFTLWGPRQTGKTWIMRRARDEIRARYQDRFTVAIMTLQGMMDDDEPAAAFLRSVPQRIRESFDRDIPPPASFDDWLKLFARHGGLFDRPTILLIDEFDSLTPKVIDRLVALFRQIYLSRESYWLHGLALGGVRAVLGMETQRGSPFNIQRSMHIPNLTQDEVREMYAQYQQESGQAIGPAIVDRIFEMTRGQPGLVSWLGELLTGKYNPDRSVPIGEAQWDLAWTSALEVEPNNTVLNLISKARTYIEPVISLFSTPNVPFHFEQPWCNHLYLNGVIDFEQTTQPNGRRASVCRFSCPFIQLRLYHAFSDELVRNDPLPLVDLRDDMADVYLPTGLDVPALLRRYRDYLARLRKAGRDPWKGEPRRADLHITEAVGHFHLYAWLNEVLNRRAAVIPEFPTGNGKVDLVIRYQDALSLIEVKSLRQRSDLVDHRVQVARYARQKGLATATLAVFVPVLDEDLLDSLASVEIVEGVEVTTHAFG